MKWELNAFEKSYGPGQSAQSRAGCLDPKLFTFSQISACNRTSLPHDSVGCLIFFKRQILTNPKRKEFADDNSKFNENGEKFFSKTVEKLGKE